MTCRDAKRWYTTTKMDSSRQIVAAAAAADLVDLDAPRCSTRQQLSPDLCGRSRLHNQRGGSPSVDDFATLAR